jgi:hypothetical protein
VKSRKKNMEGNILRIKYQLSKCKFFTTEFKYMLIFGEKICENIIFHMIYEYVPYVAANVEVVQL